MRLKTRGASVSSGRRSHPSSHSAHHLWEALWSASPVSTCGGGKPPPATSCICMLPRAIHLQQHLPYSFPFVQRHSWSSVPGLSAAPLQICHKCNGAHWRGSLLGSRPHGAGRTGVCAAGRSGPRARCLCESPTHCVERVQCVPHMSYGASS